MWKNRNNNLARVIFLIVFILSVALVLFLIYSKPLPEYSEKRFISLGTDVRIYVSGDKVSSETLIDVGEKEINRVYEKFSTNIEKSVVHELNTNRSVTADEETLFLIQAAVNMAQITGGTFDPTIRPIVKLWGFDDENALKKVPSESEIKNLLPYVNYKYIDIDKETSVVKLLKDGTEVDLGGLAKGYAVDRAIQRIKDLDPKATGFIDAGGDIGIIGPKYGKLPWSIGVRDPFSVDYYKTIDIVYLKNGAIATSGNYERYFMENGKRYHHLIDPATGYPSDDAVSSTVISDKVMNADAFATALFIMGYHNNALEYYTNFGLQAEIFDASGESTKTSGFDYFKDKER
ncbi:MAG: FAD:protein FMN transferase [Thermotogae bacterium]|nr:FAD:protein FMN transferase [Thermotogota bacterium]